MKRCMSFILVLLLLFSLVPFSASAASSMKASGNIIAYIKEKEGCRLEAYKLQGEDYWTIGYGHRVPMSSRVTNSHRKRPTSSLRRISKNTRPLSTAILTSTISVSIRANSMP